MSVNYFYALNVFNSQQNLSDLEKQVQDYKDALHRLHCICKDKAIDESINGRTDSSKTKEFEKEYCDVQETVQLVMENISK